MTALATVIVFAVFLGCMALLVHPLLRFLKISEVPAALLSVCTGRLNRRRLLFILRSRRQVYLEDIACLPPGPLWAVLAWNSTVALVRRRLAFAWKHGPLVRPPREKTLADEAYPVPSAAHMARALEVHLGSVSVRGIGPRQAEVTVHAITDRDYNCSEHRNPWARQVNAELSRHRREVSETERWARVERNWRDIR